MGKYDGIIDMLGDGELQSESTEVNVMECPFRHEEQSLEIIKASDGFHVLCNVCGALGPCGNEEQSAVEKWNDRDIAVISDEAYKRLTGQYVA